MKTKRILAMAMAMIMTFVVFCVPASAVEGVFLKPIVGIEGGNTTVAAGDTVNITLAFESTDQYNEWGGGLLTLGWDSSKVTFSNKYPTFSGVWDGEMSTSSENFNTSSTALDGITWSSDDEAKGYDSAFALFLLNGKSYSIVDGQVVLSCEFTVAEDLAPGTEIYIGIADGMYDGRGTYLTNAHPDIDMDIYEDETEWNEGDFGLSSYDKSASYVKLTVKENKPAVVFHNKVQVQWANEAENTINLGFKGYFKSADIGITFDGNNKAENVTAVGAEVTGAKTATGEGKYVFTPDEGTTYYFRGVIEGLDLDDSAQANTPITVRYFVVYNGEKLYSDPVSLKTAAEYAEVLKK